MDEFNDIKLGWDFMSNVISADLVAKIAVSDQAKNILQNQSIEEQNKRIIEIHREIENLRKSINEHTYVNTPVDIFKGYATEEWHAHTFNIDAMRHDSTHRAKTLHENTFGSVDIDTDFGKQYSLKYSNTAKDAENMQAIIDMESGRPKYEGQERLIAAEQVEEAKNWAEKRRLKDAYSRPKVSFSHEDTEKHLVGKISDGEGNESLELTNKEAKKIAAEAKKGKFDPEKHGISKDPLIEKAKINYVNGALKAGLSAAAITAIMELVPELYKSVDYLIKNGYIDKEEIKKSGGKVISASGESFLTGSVAYIVDMAVDHGLLGDALKEADPSLVGAVVTIILGTVKDSIYVASGKITSREMGARFVDRLILTSGCFVSMKIGGAIAQALFPELPGIGYAIGSLLGCVIAVVYNIGKKKLISFCVDTGFTCFGLVEQDYQLPEDVLREMGVDIIPVLKTKISKTDIDTINVENHLDVVEYETIKLTVLKRGIIGVNKIGYVTS